MITEGQSIMLETLKGHVVFITPTWAQALLDGQAPNRKIDRQLVARYRRDMLAGLWQVNGEPIIIDITGRMRDGQHRCLACVEAGVGFWSFLVEGVDPATAPTLDTGASKSAADHLTIRGIADAHVAASAGAWYWRLRHVHPGVVPAWHHRPGQQDINQAVEGTNLRASVAFILRLKGLKGPKGAFAAVHCLLTELGQGPTISAFFTSFIQGTDVAYKSPVWHLRDRLEGRHRFEQVEVLAYLLKAYFAYRDGRPMGMLKWARDVEIFPDWREQPADQGGTYNQ